MKSLKTSSVLLAVVFATSCANAKPPRGERQPPEEAIAACEGQEVDATVTFTTPRGDEVEGTCKLIEEMLVAVPEHGGRGERGERGER